MHFRDCDQFSCVPSVCVCICARAAFIFLVFNFSLTFVGSSAIFRGRIRL